MYSDEIFIAPSGMWRLTPRVSVLLAGPPMPLNRDDPKVREALHRAGEALAKQIDDALFERLSCGIKL